MRVTASPSVNLTSPGSDLIDVTGFSIQGALRAKGRDCRVGCPGHKKICEHNPPPPFDSWLGQSQILKGSVTQGPAPTTKLPLHLPLSFCSLMCHDPRHVSSSPVFLNKSRKGKREAQTVSSTAAFLCHKQVFMRIMWFPGIQVTRIQKANHMGPHPFPKPLGDQS